jgi:DNA polymerase sigma
MASLVSRGGPTQGKKAGGTFKNRAAGVPPAEVVLYSLPPLPIYVNGPRRLRNKTKAERNGPRKRRRKKKKPDGAAAGAPAAPEPALKASGGGEVGASPRSPKHSQNVNLSFPNFQFGRPQYAHNIPYLDNSYQTEQMPMHHLRKQRKRPSIHEAFFPPRRTPANAQSSSPLGTSDDILYSHYFDASIPTGGDGNFVDSGNMHYKNEGVPSFSPQHAPLSPPRTVPGMLLTTPPSPPRVASWWANASQDHGVGNGHFWTSYVTAAAEVERKRRIDEHLEEEQKERRERQEWARRAIEAEQARILEEYKLNQDYDTVEASSAGYTEDYIVVCPNSARGCVYEGKLRNIARHLLQCEFAGENTRDGTADENVDFHDEEYAIMCPYAYFGCDHCCTKKKLEAHIQSCSFRGATREDEAKARRESIISAIAATEEEQQRRVVEEAQRRHELSNDDGRSGSTPLQKVMELQTEILQRRIGEELIEFSMQCRASMDWRRSYCENIIHRISVLLEKINPHVFIIPYGSYATGFSLPESDLDLVLASRSKLDDEQNGRELLESDLNDILLSLSKELNTSQWASSVQLITTAIVPVMKFVVSLPHTQQNSDVLDVEKDFTIPVDITVQNLQHAGIATVEFVKTIAKCVPQIVPVTILLKKCLKQKDLLDPFSGGLPAYGLFLLVTSIVLQHVEIFDIEGILEENQDDSSFTCTSPLPCEKFIEKQKNYGKDTAVSICESIMFAQSQKASKSPGGKTRLRARSVSRGTEAELGEEDQKRDIIRLGRLFMHILHFIGRSFEPEIDNVSIRYGGLGPVGNIDPIMLDDPLSPGNNVGRRCYKISEIQKLCGDALTELYSILVRRKGHHSVGRKATVSVLDKVFPGSILESKI